MPVRWSGAIEWAEGAGSIPAYQKVIEERSCHRLAIRVGGRCQAKDVVAVHKNLTSHCPALEFISTEYGADFVVHDLSTCCMSSGKVTTYIEPESKLPNGYAESVNSKFRDELLNAASLSEPSLDQPRALGVRLTQAALGPPGADAPERSSRSCSMTTRSHCA